MYHVLLSHVVIHPAELEEKWNIIVEYCGSPNVQADDRHTGDILVGLFPSLQGDLQLLGRRKAIYPFCSQCLDFGKALLSAKVIVGVQQQVQIL